MKRLKDLFIASVAAAVVVTPIAASAQTVVKDYPLSSGVQYKQYTYNTTSQNTINHLQIDLNDQYTAIKLGLPTSLYTTQTTTAIANKDTAEGNRVVGTINAAFFNMSEGYPLFLLAQHNEILNGGVISTGADEYVNQPIAFGLTKDNKAAIESFDFKVGMTFRGQQYELSGMNRQRNVNEAIIYTPQHYKSTTDANEFGVEIVVDTGALITSNHFGQTITGKVVGHRYYGTKTSSTIPKNGFVISVNGAQWRTILEDAKVGEEISVNFSINEQWQDAPFILATGPLLVRDGQVKINMSTSSSRAKEIAPRTVVGIDDDSNKVHFITVDGRQSHSRGMNMTQLANYLVSLGVDRAINLDGGGSTAMGIREYGSNKVVLANKPSNSNNVERRVSATLQAISTAPLSTPKYGHFKRTNVGTLLVGTSSDVTMNYVLDEYYNPFELNVSRMALSAIDPIVTINGMKLTAATPGTTRVYVQYDGINVQSFPLTIVDAPATMTIAGESQLTEGGKTNYNVDAKDASNNPLVYNASAVKWSVEGDIGTVSADGTFTATKVGTGKIVAQLGTKAQTFNVTVKAAALFSDVPATYKYFSEIEYLAKNKIVTGYGDGTFKPLENLSREHGAVIISRALGLDATNVTDPGFSDVPTTHRYYKEIAAVQNAGIISGKPGNVFDPSGKLTRGQMAKIVALAYQLEGTSDKTFSDIKEGSETNQYVQALAANGVTTGYGDGTFKPLLQISREHFGLFLYRAIEHK